MGLVYCIRRLGLPKQIAMPEHCNLLGNIRKAVKNGQEDELLNLLNILKKEE